MKKLIPLLLLCLPRAGWAASVEASWDAVTLDVNGQPENIAYYILYYGLSPRPSGVVHPDDTSFAYDNAVSVGNITRVRRDDLVGGNTYYFAVTAVDTSGNQSAYSAEVSVDVPMPEDGGQPDGGIEDGGTTDSGNTDGGVQQDEQPADEGGAGDQPPADEQGGPDTQPPSDEPGANDSGLTIVGGCSCSSARQVGFPWLLVVAVFLLASRSRRPE